ncbi:hypothetical protein SS50377_26154 [Spironucleus salmonicida]|uniref:Lebercilin domain-containing protein n=1 Tax=Spironucleus salmonicida TaxID=348837 RepID=V6LK11_9EUKA|nr:hypothetical protein SS50377_26154 [Spironucleus salmonicida]|eukprot:EST44887.1 hypothetical protein SS50377_15178 [Spironucleus salmonicida]
MPPKFNDQALKFTTLHSQSPQVSPTRPSSGSVFNRPTSAASQKSNNRPLSSQSYSKQANINKSSNLEPNQIPINAHPSEVVAAYERLVKRETQVRGTDYNLSQYQSMADEIQALRKERKDLQDKFRLQKTETIKLEQKNSSLIKEIEMLARQPLQLNEMFKTRQVDYVALKAKESQPSIEYVKSLKRKIRELYEANQELQNYIKTMNDRTKVVKLMELEKSFRVYFDRYNQLRQQNQDIQLQLTEIAQENIYLKKRLEYSENQPLNVNHELYDDVEQILFNQRPQIEEIDEKSEDFNDDINIKSKSPLIEYKMQAQTSSTQIPTQSLFLPPSRNASMMDTSNLPEVSTLIDSLQKRQQDQITTNKRSQDQILLNPQPSLGSRESGFRHFGTDKIAQQFADYSEIDNESRNLSTIDPIQNQTMDSNNTNVNFGVELCGVTQISESETLSYGLQQSVQHSKLPQQVNNISETINSISDDLRNIACNSQGAVSKEQVKIDEIPSIEVRSSMFEGKSMININDDVPSIDINSNMFESRVNIPKLDDVPSLEVKSGVFEVQSLVKNSVDGEIPSIDVNSHMFESKLGSQEVPSIDVQSGMFDTKSMRNINDEVPSIDVKSGMFESKLKEVSIIEIPIPQQQSNQSQMLSSRRESFKQDFESLLD